MSSSAWSTRRSCGRHVEYPQSTHFRPPQSTHLVPAEHSLPSAAEYSLCTHRVLTLHPQSTHFRPPPLSRVACYGRNVARNVNIRSSAAGAAGVSPEARPRHRPHVAGSAEPLGFLARAAGRRACSMQHTASSAHRRKARASAPTRWAHPRPHLQWDWATPAPGLAGTTWTASSSRTRR